METRHIAIARTPGTPLAEFLAQIAEEVRKLEAAGEHITDMSFMFPDSIAHRMEVVATIYFRVQQPTNGYSICTQEIVSSPKEGAVLALIQNVAASNEWLAKHTDNDFYEARTDLFVDSEGRDIARTRIYYYPQVPTPDTGAAGV